MAKALAGFLLLFLAFNAHAFRKRVTPKKILPKQDNKVSEASLVEAESSSQPSPKTKFMDWVLSDLVQIDASQAEEKLRKTTNVLQPSEKEHVVMAFKCGNDKTYFTNLRILFRPKGWFISRSTKYESIPYSSIQSYGTQTAGIWPDMDTDFWLWTQMPDLPYIALEFKAGETNAEIFEVMKFLTSKVQGEDTGSALLQHKSYHSAAAKWGFTDLWHWLRDNAYELNATAANELYHEVYPLLQNDETVAMAYQSGRDKTLLTNKRMIRIDVTGITGYSVIYESHPWSTVKAYSVRNAGTFDDNQLMTIWTSIPEESQRKLKQSLRGFGEGTANVVTIQKFFSDHVLGNKNVARVLPHDPEKEAAVTGLPKGMSIADIMAFLGGDFDKQDAALAESRLRATAPILLDDEHVEIAFQKVKPAKDIIYLTTRRVIWAKVHLEVLFGALVEDKVDYFSLPYSSILAFEAETKAAWDLDSVFKIYTGISPPPPLVVPNEKKDDKEDKKDDKKNKTSGGGGQQSSVLQKDESSPPNPGMNAGKNDKVSQSPDGKATVIVKPGKSMLDFEIKAGTDLLMIQKFLHAKLTGFKPASVIAESDLAQAPDNDIESDWSPSGLYHWLDGNAKQFSPEEAEKRLQQAGPILQQGEKVQKAFTTWRDMTLLTNQRVLVVDIQSIWKFKKVVYTTVPYSSIRGFGIRSGGTFDFDAEIVLYTQMPWKKTVEQSLVRGTAKIAELQGLLCDQVLGAINNPSALLETEQSNPVGDFIDWLGSNAGEIDVKEAEARLSQDPPVLVSGEKIQHAYKVGLDMTMFTNYRILVVDRSHWDIFAEKLEYRTIPYNSILGFSVETATTYFDRDEEIVVYTDMLEYAKFEQDIAVGQGDIFQVQSLLSENSL